MSNHTTIEWTNTTWNPVTGCTKVSPGCDNCYAETIANRFAGGPAFPKGFEVMVRPDKVNDPLRWRKPRKVFVNSMSDLFHDKVPDEWLADIFAVMATAQRHTFQVLTKRHGRMKSIMSNPEFVEKVKARAIGKGLPVAEWVWPLPNVWLGVSVEDQKRADLRIPALLDTPAAVRFLSCEPLLGPVDLNGPADIHGHRSRLTYWLTGHPGWGSPEITSTVLELHPLTTGPRIDWVIVGGESGRSARPMHPDWVRSLRDQCVDAGVPFFFKQWGEWAPESVCATEKGAKSALYVEYDGATRPAARGARGDAVTVQRNGKNNTGRVLDGDVWDEFPASAA